MSGNSEGLLVVDIGGSRMRLMLAEGGPWREVPTGRDFRPQDAVRQIQELADVWRFDRIAIGCPGPVRAERVVAPPLHLGPGWVGFDFAAALGRPVRLVNDALLQAMGAWRGGRMLYLGLGTGLGAALVAEGVAVSLELGQLLWPAGGTFEDRLGARGLARNGREVWLSDLARAIAIFAPAMIADEVVLGGGNARLVEPLPPGCRTGDPEAFVRSGALRLWQAEMRVL